MPPDFLKGIIIMLAKTITYTDFDGNSRTETLYFNLSKAELTEFAYSGKENISEVLNKAITDNDVATIVRFLNTFVVSAYGEKSSDGKVFLKNEKMKDEFAHSAAYYALFDELVSDDKKAEAFIMGVVPSGLTADKAGPIEMRSNS